jgi:hypothetical protein
MLQLENETETLEQECEHPLAETIEVEGVPAAYLHIEIARLK